MTQQEMCGLLDIPERTLRDWKKGKRKKLYKLMEVLDYNTAQELLKREDNNDLKRLLENEKHFKSLRDFEKSLYEVLVSGRDNKSWLKLSKDTNLSKEARSRAAYLYSFQTNKKARLSFKTEVDVGFYHGNKNTTGSGLAKLYGLRNGVDMQRFNQYKMTGSF